MKDRLWLTESLGGESDAMSKKNLWWRGEDAPHEVLHRFTDTLRLLCASSQFLKDSKTFESKTRCLPTANNLPPPIQEEQEDEDQRRRKRGEAVDEEGLKFVEFHRFPINLILNVNKKCRNTGNTVRAAETRPWSSLIQSKHRRGDFGETVSMRPRSHDDLLFQPLKRPTVELKQDVHRFKDVICADYSLFFFSHLLAESKLFFTKSLKGLMCSSFVNNTWFAML